MPQLSPGDILRAWFEVIWNQGRIERAGEYFAADGIVHALHSAGSVTIGPEEFKPFFAQIKGALPDIRFTMHDVMESGQMACGRWSATATHTGDHLGVKATGNAIALTGIAMLRCENGVMVEAWNEWDRLTMALGIGSVVAAG